VNSAEHVSQSRFHSKADMPSTTLSNRRVAIFEDNPRNRERLSDMVRRCGAIALPVNGPAPALNGLKAFLKTQQADLVVCDHHLSQKDDYAPFLGAEAVAKCYELGIAAILVTAFENTDAESSLRVFRRRIPALIRSPDNFDRTHVEAALLQAEKEVHENNPSRERVPHRAVMTVQRIEQHASTKIVKVMMAQWNAGLEVGFPLELVPTAFQSHVKPGKLLIAEVNIGAERQEDLFFDKFELPDAKILKKAETVFGRS
jgi:CheY-like chemotaxis protein